MEIKEEKDRFVLLNDENQEIGEMTWSNAGDKMMIIDHTFVDPAYRGQKLAEKLVMNGVEKARREEKKIIPLCPFAKKEFDRKPEYGDVLRK
ncbi:GNAT family acetyltransferase [Enterococcus moraviensis ATCC BAA-383]|uniref:GNAT family acetyltransferase n=1 Tax=Enterococcus moraviensis ATCC BAA-383 TaxID=1158609 RepID=R2QU91_9ENTE|nr:GNAT family N-acetyltransferase [Enterococcus moraviensis]EOH98888.1 GNAT family acetyltransferase [Enterococcus moraviensis ATCC BAA-383]EOT71937.1 GNAT family acetyltransferase [Enterococcus moraviensis ATCC BAA-383]OJG68056.1 GNAT family acetyltransferase [Enterococcus moraviensis]